MRTTRIAVLAVSALAAGALLVGCGGDDDAADDAAAPTTEPAPMTTTMEETTTMETAPAEDAVYTEANTTITTTTGGQFTIELPANPSTGYSWRVNVPMGYTQISEEMLEPAAGEEDMVGVPTMQRWVFQADTAGMGDITFDELAPGSETPERTVTFNVTAE